MQSSSFIGTAEKGRFVPDEPMAVKMALGAIEGKRILVTVERYRKPRSTGKPTEEGNQNGYYFRVVVPMIAKAIGESVENTHDLLKREHNSKIVVIGDKEISVPQSTAKMNTLEFEEYLERVKTWAAEFFPMYIPDPDKTKSTRRI